MAVTSGDPGGTSGGTSGGSIGQRDRVVLVTVVMATLMVAVVNAFSVADELAEAGITVAGWEPWVWELTSALFWILIALPMVRILRRLRPPALALPWSILAILLLSLPVCALHMGFLGISRAAVYALVGQSYSYDWSVDQLVYEWRKDVLSVAIFAGICFVIDRMFDLPALGPAKADDPVFRLEVRDGSRTRWLLPSEIERIEAAGNYVELHTAAGAVLHRATLARVADQLAAHGFARIHRSRLVRRDAITAVAATPSGDFEATLASGATVAGSRRFRAGLGR
jgi:hypothetical protein